MGLEPDRTQTVELPRDPHADRAPLLRLTVTLGPDAGRVLVTSASRTTVVGRAPTADLRLADPTVSQFHVELESISDSAIGVRDLDSHNGTYVQDVAIGVARVAFGAELRLGGTRIVIDPAEQRAPRSKAMSFGRLVGASTSMRDVYTLLERLANTDLSVLIEGETGTGKDVAARSLHEQGPSPRAGGPFVTLDCTTIPPGLAESVLFGHEKGAFTGATERHVGALESASGGTLFLDELGELPLPLQAKLLRVLERREIVRLGGSASKTRSIDIRLICATWRDLRAMVNRGEFREDLYFRVAQAHVRMPSLADRPEDKRPLIVHFLSTIPATVRAARSIDEEALAALASRPFPGNVRELKTAVERLSMLASQPTITIEDVSFDRMLDRRDRWDLDLDSDPDKSNVAASPASELLPFKEAKRSLIEDFERTYLTKLLARSGKSVSRAARLAKIERQTFRDLLQRHNIQFEE